MSKNIHHIYYHPHRIAENLETYTMVHKLQLVFDGLWLYGDNQYVCKALVETENEH